MSGRPDEISRIDFLSDRADAADQSDGPSNERKERMMSSNGTIDRLSTDSLRSWLIGWLADAVAIDHRRIHPGRTFLSYGLDSILALLLVGDLEATFGGRLPPTLAWDYPSVEAMAIHLADRLRTRAAGTRPAPVTPPGYDGTGTPAEGPSAGTDHPHEVRPMMPLYA